MASHICSIMLLTGAMFTLTENVYRNHKILGSNGFDMELNELLKVQDCGIKK